MSFSGEPDIEEAICVLKRGGLVAYPTDTLYGLGAHAFIESAVERVYEAKGRSQTKAIPLLLSSIDDLSLVTDQTGGLIDVLARAFWPGALTMVVKSKAVVSGIVRGGGDTIAVRVPDHPVPRELVTRLGAPITGTSANRARGLDPVDADMVRDQLGDEVDLIIDRGPCSGDQPSTVIDVSSDRPVLLRLGAIGQSDIERVCGALIIG